MQLDRSHDSPVVEKVTTCVHWCRCLVEAVVDQHKDLVVYRILWWNVESKSNVPTGTVIANLLPIHPNTTVEGTALKLQSSPGACKVKVKFSSKEIDSTWYHVSRRRPVNTGWNGHIRTEFDGRRIKVWVHRVECSKGMAGDIGSAPYTIKQCDISLTLKFGPVGGREMRCRRADCIIAQLGSRYSVVGVDMVFFKSK